MLKYYNIEIILFIFYTYFFTRNFLISSIKLEKYVAKTFINIILYNFTFLDSIIYLKTCFY